MKCFFNVVDVHALTIESGDGSSLGDLIQKLSRFWSKKNLNFEAKIKILGVFEDGDFKFLDPKSKFERNWTKDFQIFKINPGPNIPNRNRISGFGVLQIEF